jgi:hypothetical protein
MSASNSQDNSLRTLWPIPSLRASSLSPPKLGIAFPPLWSFPRRTSPAQGSRAQSRAANSRSVLAGVPELESCFEHFREGAEKWQPDTPQSNEALEILAVKECYHNAVIRPAQPNGSPLRKWLAFNGHTGTKEDSMIVRIGPSNHFNHLLLRLTKPSK